MPLASFARYEPTLTPLAVNHQGQFAASTISFNLPVGVSLSDATRAINDAMLRIGVPTSVHGSFQGTAKAFQDSLDNQPLLILAAVIAVYLVLGILYESLIHPLTILSTLPSAGVGAILALLAFGSEFSIIALIGVILLIGIVKKNAIMMIDFALDAERNEGLSPRDAIHRACLLRFRPIMMTTMAALFGAIPLAIGFSDGSEFRRPLGIAIVGGLDSKPAIDAVHDACSLSLSRPFPVVVFENSAAAPFRTFCHDMSDYIFNIKPEEFILWERLQPRLTCYSLHGLSRLKPLPQTQHSCMKIDVKGCLS